MNSTQRVIENLLLATRASRAMFQIARPDGSLAIEAEAVQHDQDQLRHRADKSAHDARAAETLARPVELDIEENIAQARSSPGSQTKAEAITARMMLPVASGARIAGVISLHHSTAPRWNAQDQDEIRLAQAKVSEILSQRAALDSPARADLRCVATQAILDRLRTALDVQRCTFRQPVQDAFAFPVTFESRANGLRSLLGDFTIVQTGQPVIVKLLEGRKQVVQEDCRTASSDPLFHKMLAHYGGMQAQVVTPFIIGDQLKGVLSIHELRGPRKWTTAEKALAAEATVLIGVLFEAAPAHR